MAFLKDLLVTGAARFLNGIYGDLNGNVLNYGVCNTQAGTQAKEVELNGTFELKEGSEVAVKFINGNTTSNPTLNVNSTGAKNILMGGTNAPSSAILANYTYLLRYNGSAWDLIGSTIAERIGTSSVGSATHPIYLKDGVPSTTTYSLSATVNGGTANRIAYYSGNNAISSGSITTDGGYLGNISRLSVNTADQTDYQAYINGTTFLNGDITIGSSATRAIKHKGTKSTYSMIRFLDNTANGNGNGLSIGGGGVVIVGSGESASNFQSLIASDTEQTYLLSDGGIFIEANGQTIANRLGLSVTTAGHLTPVKAEVNNNNAQSLGISGNRWKAAFLGSADSYGSTAKGIYWNNGVPTEMTYSVNANVQAGTAEKRIAWYSSTNTISSGTIATDGAYLSNASYITVNEAHQTSYRLKVNGTSYLNGNTIINGTAQVTSHNGYTGLNDTYGLRIGPNDNTHIDLGYDGIQALSASSSAVSSLYLQYGGGNVQHGHSGAESVFTNWGNVNPGKNNTYHLGTSSLAWRYIYSNGIIVNNANSNSTGGIALYGTTITNYGIAMRTGAAHGWITSPAANENIAAAQGINASDATGLDLAINFYNSGSKLRGFKFIHASTAVASINGYGYAQVNRLGLNRNGGIANGRLYWFDPSYYVWVDYMSDSTAGAAPTGGQPSTTTEVTSWAKRSLITNSSGRGWIWEAAPNTVVASTANTTKPTARMSLSSYTGRLRIEANAATTTNQNGSLIISSALNGSSGNVGLELWRGSSKASWMVSNEGGTLYFRNNYTTAAQTTYSQNSLILDYNTGAGSIPNLAIGQTSRNTTYKLYVNGTSYLNGETIFANTILLGKNSIRYDTSNNTKLFVLPLISYSTLNVQASSDELYMQALLKWICTNYPNVSDGTWLGLVSPGSKGYASIHIYDTSKVNSSTGLPEYSDFTYTPWGGIGGQASWVGGTGSYTFYMYKGLNAHNYSSYALPLTGGTLSGNVIISKSDGEPQSVVEYTGDNAHKIYMCASTGGNAGIYDGTHSKWIVKSDLSGNITLNGNANTATKFATARKIDGVSFDGSADIVHYGTCTTAAATQAKVVTCAGFSLVTGARVYVRFSNAQTYNGQPTLNVNSTGAKNVCFRGTTAAVRYQWNAGEVLGFVYDGTNWIIEAGGIASTTYYGNTKLSSSLGSTSTSLAATPSTVNALRSMLNDLPGYSSSATYNVGDRVYHNTDAYECITAITTAEDWTDAHWTKLDSLQTQIDKMSIGVTSGTYSGFFNGQIYTTNEGSQSAISGPIPAFLNSTAGDGYKAVYHNSSFMYYYRNGKDSSTKGYAILRVGNGQSSSAAGGTQGYLRLYSEGTTFGQLQMASTPSQSITINLPAIEGELVSCQGAQTVSGAKTFSGENTFTGSNLIKNTNWIIEGSVTKGNNPGGTCYKQLIVLDKSADKTWNATTHKRLQMLSFETYTNGNTVASLVAYKNSATEGDNAVLAAIYDKANSVAYATAPTYTGLNDNSTKIVTTAYLRNIFRSGTAAATTSNCPMGCFYFKYY